MTSLYERDARALSAMSFLRFFPQAVTGGEGSYLFDERGRRLLDLSASWGAASLGHSHPAVRAAVDRALSAQAGASHRPSSSCPPTAPFTSTAMGPSRVWGSRTPWLAGSVSIPLFTKRIIRPIPDPPAVKHLTGYTLFDGIPPNS
jgi:hypothetical protein